MDGAGLGWFGMKWNDMGCLSSFFCEQRQDQQKKAKQTKAEMDAAMAELFRAAIVQPPVPPGVDPKNIVCEFFKQNACTKVGNKWSTSLDWVAEHRQN